MLMKAYNGTFGRTTTRFLPLADEMDSFGDYNRELQQRSVATLRLC